MRNPDERGVVLPSPVVLLSIIAVAMAAVAFVATRGAEPQQREVAIVARDQAPSPTATATPTATPEPKKAKKKRKPAVDRSKTYVEVYNNSGISGLAGTVGSRASDIGWQVVGTDNWYGTIPVTTVYYPGRLEAAAKQLALDLGVERTAPIVDPMRGDRLTLILTDPLG